MIAAIACLVLAKAANVGVPILLKQIVDSLDADDGAAVRADGAARRVRPAAPVDHGVHRAARVPVRQGDAARGAQDRAERCFAICTRCRCASTCSGRRAASRATSSAASAASPRSSSYALFSILPTIVEIALVDGDPHRALRLDVHRRSPAARSRSTSRSRSLVTEWRTHFRRTMNELDSKANTRAIDSLHQLRDGQVLRQRGMGGAPLRREPAALGDRRR